MPWVKSLKCEEILLNIRVLFNTYITAPFFPQILWATLNFKEDNWSTEVWMSSFLTQCLNFGDSELITKTLDLQGIPDLEELILSPHFLITTIESGPQKEK